MSDPLLVRIFFSYSERVWQRRMLLVTPEDTFWQLFTVPLGHLLCQLCHSLPVSSSAVSPSLLTLKPLCCSP